MLIMLSFANRGKICSPENSLLCVFGQANPAPTVNDLAGWFSFDTYQASLYRKLTPNHQQFIDVVRAISHSPSSPD